MFKRIFTILLITTALFTTKAMAVNVASGNIFTITESGALAELSFLVCLNVNSTVPVSCEEYTVHRATIGITTTIPNHVYRYAGIKFTTPGYKPDSLQSPAAGYYFIGLISQTISASVTAEPIGQTVPGAPTGVSATAGNSQATVTWTAPSSDGGSALTGYTVTASGVGGQTCTATPPTTSCTVTGLTNGTSYTFTVVAINAIGNSAASSASASVTPATVPGAPTGVSATAGNAQATVTWTVPVSNGGSALTGYTVTASGVGGQTCTATPPTTSCTVTGLTNGTSYTFTVVATNAIGNSAASTASAPVTPALQSTLTAAGFTNTSPLLVVSTNSGTSWSQISIATTNGQFNSSTCSSSSSVAVCTAVGQDTDSSLPILYQSTNGGSSWSVVNLGITNTGTFNSTSCAGSGSTALCTVVGVDTTNGIPILYQSSDGGNSWSAVTNGIIDTGTFHATSCSGSGNTAICTAVGEDNINTGLPLLYQSTNGGSSWSVATTIANTGRFNSTSCAGSGSTALCTAAGEDTVNLIPMLYQSRNGGSSWSAVNLGVAINVRFYSTSCSASGSSARCTATGEDPVIGKSLYQSTNGGTSWTVVPSSPIFYSTSCSGSGSTTRCTAAGVDVGNTPILYRTINGGTLWSAVNLSITNLGALNSTSCSGSGSTTLCTVAGVDSTTNAPLLYQTTNGGSSWSKITTGIPVTGTFNSTSSSGNQ